MPISYGDGGDIPPKKKKEPTTKVEGTESGATVVEEDNESHLLLKVEPVDPLTNPSGAFSRLPVVEVPDRLGHLVDLTPRDIRALKFDEDGAEGIDHDGDDFTPI